MTGQTEPESLFNRKRAAKYLDVAPGTLAVWDCTKRYDLKPIKVGRAVRYRRADLDRFLEERQRP
ncbi:MAG: helix-turn-helix domain-containing protein [Williamsia sp.]|nr:helix-turn-helix domain-containing protein [Williamsia sp.]